MRINRFKADERDFIAWARVQLASTHARLRLMLQKREGSTFYVHGADDLSVAVDKLARAQELLAHAEEVIARAQARWDAGVSDK